MASTEDLFDAESSDDDSISLTSTVLSTEQEEYVIDGGVLAEKNDNGTMLYLIKWDGYGEERNSWEPADCFSSDMTLKEWEADKMRIAKCTKKAFDVAAWEKRKGEIDEETEIRRQRRQQKKQSMNQDVDMLLSSDETSGDSSSSDDSQGMARDHTIPSRRSAPKALSSADDEKNSSVQSGKRPFTDNEDRAVEAGLQREGGQSWSKIMEKYGDNGTVSQVLAGRSMLDIQERAFEMKMEFVRHGRDVPQWLKPVRIEKTSRLSNPTLMEPSVEEALQVSKTHGGSSNTEPRAKQGSLNTATRLPKGSKSGVEQQQQSLVGAPATSNRYAGTGRFSEAAPLAPKPVRLGVRGAGPTRLRVSKPLSSKIRRKASGTAVDVMANWNAKPMERNVDPNRAAIAKNEPAKFFKNLSSQNRFNRRTRNEPAPNPDRLIFIDRKTGKAPKDVAAPSPVLQSPQRPAKTPMQKFRDELIAKDAQVGETHIDLEPDDAGTNTGVAELMDIDGITSASSGGAKYVLKDLVDDSNRTGGLEQHTKQAGDLTDPHSTTLSEDVRALSDMRSSDKAKAGELSTPHNQAKRQNTHLDSASAQPGELVEGGWKSKSSSAPLYVQSSASTGASFTASTRPAPAQLSLSQPGPRDPNDVSFIMLPSFAAIKDLFNVRSPHLIIGQLKLGAGDQILPRVKFEGISPEIHRLFLSIKVMPSTMIFEFKSFCAATDYQAFFNADTSELLGSGYIVCYAEFQRTVENFAERLAYDVSGGLFFAERFTMLIYPVGADAWSFLDKDLPSPPDGAVLRFVVAKPMPKEWVNESIDESKELLALKEANPKRYEELERKLLALARPILPGEANINIVFQDLFEINYNRLISQDGSEAPAEQPPFFLFFVPSGCDEYEPDPVKRHALRLRTSEEHDLFVQFLQTNGVKEIYSTQDVGSIEPQMNGAWDYFRKNVKSGVIIFHHDFLRKDWVPGLGRLLHNVGINVWRTSMEVMDLEPHPHLVRLYPHGAVILLTESLFLYRPREALRLLRWFRYFLLPAKVPLTWKIAVRPRLGDWLWDIIDAIHDSEKDLFASDGNEVFASIYLEICELLLDENGHTLIASWDHHTPGDNAPIIASSSMRALKKRKAWKGTGPDTEVDHKNIQKNDDSLVEWISQYAIFECHVYRRFHCVIGFKDAQIDADRTARQYEELHGHLEVFTPDRFFKRHAVTEEHILDKLEEERARKVHDSLEAGEVAAAQSAKELCEVFRDAFASIKQNYKDQGLDEDEAAEKTKDSFLEDGYSPRRFIDNEVNMDYHNLPRRSPERAYSSVSETSSEHGSGDSDDEVKQGDNQGLMLHPRDEDRMDTDDDDSSDVMDAWYQMATSAS